MKNLKHQHTANPKDLKLQYVEEWQHSRFFTEREKEYLALQHVKSTGLKGIHNTKAARSLAHSKLDEIWNSLEGYEPAERVTMMTGSSSHPEVMAIIS